MLQKTRVFFTVFANTSDHTFSVSEMNVGRKKRDPASQQQKEEHTKRRKEGRKEGWPRRLWLRPTNWDISRKFLSRGKGNTRRRPEQGQWEERGREREMMAWDECSRNRSKRVFPGSETRRRRASPRAIKSKSWRRGFVVDPSISFVSLRPPLPTGQGQSRRTGKRRKKSAS